HDLRGPAGRRRQLCDDDGRAQTDGARVTMRVGFVGIGNMGAPMAGHIVKAGHTVTVSDSDADRVARFASTHGCRGARTLADLGDSELVITMLPDGHIVRSVMMGASAAEGGLARHLQ